MLDYRARSLAGVWLLSALALSGCAGPARHAAGPASTAASATARPSPATTSSASAAATPSPYDSELNGPRTAAAVLPSGFHLTADGSFTSADPTTTAVFDAVKNGYAAEFQAVARQRPADPLYQDYFFNSGAGTNGLTNARSLVSWFIDHHYTVTGTLVLRDWKISPSNSAQMWRVNVCEDQSRSWSKDLRTGEVIYHPANPANYYQDTLFVAQLAAGQHWRTVYSSSTAVARCV